MLNVTSIPAPRVSFIDDRTGLMAREWYLFFLNLFKLVGEGSNDVTLSELQMGPPSYRLDEQKVDEQYLLAPPIMDTAELSKRVHALESAPIVAPVVASVPSVIMRRDASVTTTDTVFLALAWDTVVSNPDGMWLAGSPTKFTAIVPGTYLFTATTEFPVDNRMSYIYARVNGTKYYPGAGSADVESYGIRSVSVPLLLAAGDYVEAMVLTLAGGATIGGALADTPVAGSTTYTMFGGMQLIKHT